MVEDDFLDFAMAAGFDEDFYDSDSDDDFDPDFDFEDNDSEHSINDAKEVSFEEVYGLDDDEYDEPFDDQEAEGGYDNRRRIEDNLYCATCRILVPKRIYRKTGKCPECGGQHLIKLYDEEGIEKIEEDSDPADLDF